MLALAKSARYLQQVVRLSSGPHSEPQLSIWLKSPFILHLCWLECKYQGWWPLYKHTHVLAVQTCTAKRRAARMCLSNQFEQGCWSRDASKSCRIVAIGDWDWAPLNYRAPCIASHGWFALFWYFGNGITNPIVNLLATPAVNPKANPFANIITNLWANRKRKCSEKMDSQMRRGFDILNVRNTLLIFESIYLFLFF